MFPTKVKALTGPMDNQSFTKTKLTDSQENFSAYTRSESLYYNDGSIILLAQSTMFRVYKGTLERQSSIFRDMLSIPQPGKGSAGQHDMQMYDGVPVVRLYDDAESELTPFLRALFDSSYFDGSPTCDFLILIPILLLSSKYDVPFLRKRAVSYLSAVYPSKLAAWDARLNNPPFEIFLYMPFFVIPLARTHSLPLLLPAALYEASTCRITQIFEHVAPLDGTFLELTPSEKRAILVANASLGHATRNRLLAFLKAPAAADCDAGSDKCEASKLHWMRLGEDEMWGPFDKHFPWEDYAGYVCPRCLAESRESFELSRRDLWEELPSFFDLPRWEILQEQAD